MERSLCRVSRILGTSLALWICAQARGGLAQADPPRFELGVHLPVMQLKEHDGADVGLGGRFGFNLARNLALESEINYFPRNLTRLPQACPPGQQICATRPALSDRRVEGLFGVKAGVRLGRIGLFGKLRPGFLHLRNQLQVVCIAAPCPPLSSASTQFALDLGGVVEAYPSNRVALRLDLGDTYIRGTGIDLIPFASNLRHNLQLNVGVAFRF